MDEGRFSKNVIETLAKRAANICSNPDCGAITSGPADEADKSVVVGEAAHIYGVRPGSARYREAMTDAERGDITNAIWLCRNCHKKIDADVNGYPAELLFEWCRQHREEISNRLGKTSDRLREKVIARQLSEFSSCSYLAQQIVMDKPPYWEYKLTIELMRTRMEQVLRRWHALVDGLYVRPFLSVSIDSVAAWFSLRFSEMLNIAEAFSKLSNCELQKAWGPRGVPGNASDILFVCDLYVECVQSLLTWTENVKFSNLPAGCEEAKALLPVAAVRFVEQVERIPKELAAIFEMENPTGQHEIHLEVDLPDGWGDQFSKAVHAAVSRLVFH